MSDRLDLNTRNELRAKIETTLAAIQLRAVDLSAEAIAAEVQADAEEMAVRGFRLGLSAALGADMGEAVFADLTSNLDASDAELARRFGLEHSTVSKAFQRVRRNLGLPLRQPNKARSNRATKGPGAN